MEEAVSSWPAFNDFLREATEEEALRLMELERLGRARLQFLLRAYSRYNAMRARRERRELLAAVA